MPNTEPKAVAEARQVRDEASQHLARVTEGLALARERHRVYEARFQAGLSTSPATLRERIDEVEHAERLVSPAEDALVRAQADYGLVAAEELAARLQAEDLINGRAATSARQVIAGHLLAAQEAARQFIDDRNAAVEAAEQLAEDATLPRASVTSGKQPWMRLVTVQEDPLAGVWRLPRGFAVEVGDVPGAVWGISAVERTDPEVGALSLVSEELAALGAAA